jgi:hypothetical protein
MCKNMIYDILINPLPLNHILHGYINFDALKRCGVSVVYSIYRGIKDFPICPNFFIEEHLESSHILHIRAPLEPRPLTEFEKDEMIWNKFFSKYPENIEEFQDVIDKCIDAGVAKKATISKEQLIKYFLMDILRKVLTIIPTIHNDHTNKNVHTESKSLGPVCNWKIITIRRLADLPVDKYLPKNIYKF